MEREIETKFDVPVDTVDNTFLACLESSIIGQEWAISKRWTVLRNFQYYDTPMFDAYNKGETIRRIGGFNPGDHKGIFRYDFKTGPITERYEGSHWSDEIWMPNEILDKCGIEYEKIVPVAYADTMHIKRILEKGGTKIEATYDMFCVEKTFRFKELELELKEGEEAEVGKLSEKVSSAMGLVALNQQKYSRIVEGLRLV